MQKSAAHRSRISLLVVLLVAVWPSNAQADDTVTLNQKADGYRGIWYMNQPSGDEYVYKYSGGTGDLLREAQTVSRSTCAKVNKTFFCYGGANEGKQSEAVAHGFVLRSRDEVRSASHHSVGQEDQ